MRFRDKHIGTTKLNRVVVCLCEITMSRQPIYKFSENPVNRRK